MAQQVYDIEDQTALLNTWEIECLTQVESFSLTQAQSAILPPDLSLGAAVRCFLNTLKGQSAETQKTYRVGCRRFMWFIFITERGEPTKVKLADLSPLVLEDFYLWMVDTYGRKARTTISGYMAGPRNMFSYLARRHLTPGGCQYQEMVAGLSKLQGRAAYKTPRIRGKQVEQVARRALGETPKPPTTDSNGAAVEHESVADSQSLVSVRKRVARDPKEISRQNLEDARDRAIILTLYTTGMRRGEVASLNRNDIETLLSDYTMLKADPAADHDKIFELIVTGKGQKERVVYFDNVALEAIQEYLTGRGKDPYRPLFLQHHRGRDKVKPGPNGERYRISLVRIWQIVNAYARRLGVEIKPHDFRHNLATTLLNAGAQLSEVQDILGHASPTTTKQIYAHYDKGHLREAFSKFRKSASDLG